MKKVTAIFPEGVELDLGSIATHAIEVHVETIPDKAGMKIGVKPKAPATTDGVVKRKARKQPDEPGIEDIILEAFRKGKTFTRSQAIEWIADRGYAPTSVSAALTRLKKDGKIGDTDTKGKYVYLKR